MPYFSFQKSNIYYTDQGSGEPLLFVHGFLENSSMWTDIAAEFSKNFRVVCIDLPGFGKSEMLDGSDMMSLFAECTYHLVREIQLDSFTLIGHSMGGYVSLELLGLCANRIKHICLMHSTAFADTEEKKLNRTRAIQMLSDKKNVYLKTAIPLLFEDKMRLKCAGEIKKMISEAENSSTEAIVSALKGMATRKNQNDRLKTFPGRKTYLIGRKDLLLNAYHLKMEAVKNGAEILEISEAGHMSHWETPDIALEMMKEIIMN